MPPKFPIKASLDLSSAAVAIGSLVDYLPSISASLSIIWVLLRILETETVRCLLRRLMKKPHGSCKL